MYVVVYKICNSVVNMVVMGVPLGQSLIVIFTLLLCKGISPLMYILWGLLLFTHKVHCLQTCEHTSTHWVIKVYVVVKFYIHTDIKKTWEDILISCGCMLFLKTCNLVAKMLVMGLVLGPSLMVIPIAGIMLYAKVSPLYNVLRECCL